MYFFWADERAVPPTHSGSNFRMANETLLSKVPVPGENIFRVPAEMDLPKAAAEQYSETLKQFFGGSGSLRNTPATSPLGNWPRFDLILLGMGADGHTASLFPQTTALKETDSIVAANYVPKLNAHRITLTSPTINNARNVTFVVSGEDKAEMLKNVIDGPPNSALYPSQLVKPRNGTLLWLLDEAAASKLSE
jgi:6-phosphogluconolactonase